MIEALRAHPGPAPIREVDVDPIGDRSRRAQPSTEPELASIRPAPRPRWGERARDYLEWFGVGRLIVTALSVAAIGAGGYWLLRPMPTPIESSLPRAATEGTNVPPTISIGTSAPTVASATVSTVPISIVVHVAGAVVVPGVYSVAANARVVDAVEAAGGTSADARPDAINLAAPLHDGDRVYLPTVAEAPAVPAGVSAAPAGATTAGGTAASDPAAPIDLNTATAEQLDVLPGVGPSTAAAIISHREANGPFSSVDGLDEVRGIGPAKLDSLRPLVTV